MSVYIYVEGGGDNKDTLKRCRQGFATYCQKLAPPKRLPSIVACGGRQQAFKAFRTAVLGGQSGDFCVLLVDAEDRVSSTTCAAHLLSRDGWTVPDFNHCSVFLMVQAMEAWFLADREALAEFYDGGFVSKDLRGSPTDIEAVRKNDLEPCLKLASKATKTKGEYHKTKHGFALVASIDPAKVEVASPHAAEFHQFLRSL